LHPGEDFGEGVGVDAEVVEGGGGVGGEFEVGFGRQVGGVAAAGVVA
jgi:hypothetical protein